MTSPSLSRAYEEAAKVYAERRNLGEAAEDIDWIVEQEVKPLISAFLASLAKDEDDPMKLMRRTNNQLPPGCYTYIDAWDATPVEGDL